MGIKLINMSASLIVLYICLGVFIGLPCCLCCFAGIAYTIEEGRTRTIPDGKKDKRCVVKCLCGETEIQDLNASVCAMIANRDGTGKNLKVQNLGIIMNIGQIRTNVKKFVKSTLITQ